MQCPLRGSSGLDPLLQAHSLHKTPAHSFHKATTEKEARSLLDVYIIYQQNDLKATDLPSFASALSNFDTKGDIFFYEEQH